MTYRIPCCILATCASGMLLTGQEALQVGVEIPALLDLRGAVAAEWVPGDSRDPAQLQAKAEAWARRVEPFRGRRAVRLLLPLGPNALPLLLAASQALHSQDPATQVYLGWQPDLAPLWDEAAWGALQGGALLPEDLGPDPAAWTDRLAKAQAQLPGRPWVLWLPADPGPRLGQILGDGGHVVVPPGGPGAALAAPGFTEVEGGQGALTLRNPATGEVRRWAFKAGAWAPAPAPRDRHEVQVTAAAAYDVGALLAKVRAEQQRTRLAIRSLEADLAVDLHVQASQGPGSDLGFRFRWYQAAGGPEETVQKTVLFNGVRAKLNAGLQLPIVESRASMTAPAALTLTERYRYRDAGPDGPGRRKLAFEPVDADPLLYSGTLRVDEASGRILEERSSRTGLPGMVKAEDRILTYGEIAPGLWRMVKAVTYERWVVAGGIVPIQRTATFSDFVVNDPTSRERRDAAVRSDATMLQATPDGLRYFNKQKDGTRRTEDRPRSSGRGIGGLLVFDPTLPLPVVPLAGIAFFDYNAFNKGIQVSLLTAGVFTTAQATVPDLGAGFSLSSRLLLNVLPGSERPIKDGRLQDKEGVGRQFGSLSLGLGHDLGWGLRLQATGDFRYDRYQKPFEKKYWSEGFTLPPSGLTRTLTGTLSWQFKGLQLKAYRGEGWRPEGPFGMPDDLQTIEGRYHRSGGSLGYDWQVKPGRWLHGEVGHAGGTGFDRFESLELGGLGGDVRVAGIRSNSIAADRMTYAKAGLVLPTGPKLRLTLTVDQAWLRALDNQKTYQVTGLGVAGDLPGFWVFTTVRVDLGVGLLSTLPGVRSCNGFVALLRVF